MDVVWCTQSQATFVVVVVVVVIDVLFYVQLKLNEKWEIETEGRILWPKINEPRKIGELKWIGVLYRLLCFVMTDHCCCSRHFSCSLFFHFFGRYFSHAVPIHNLFICCFLSEWEVRLIIDNNSLSPYVPINRKYCQTVWNKCEVPHTNWPNCHRPNWFSIHWLTNLFMVSLSFCNFTGKNSFEKLPTFPMIKQWSTLPNVDTFILIQRRPPAR